MEQHLSQLAGLWGKYILPILEFIIGLGVIVFVHELGHFLVAKWVGIKVEQFAFGFGKRLCGFVVGETDYRINLIPLGGYVKMLGQEDFKPLKEGDKPDPRAFDQKSVGARFAVISAGVIMNVILAAVLFVIVAMVGMEYPAPVVASVDPGSKAYNAVVNFEGVAPTAAPAASPATSASPEAPPIITSAPAADAALTTRPAADPWINRLQPGDKIVHIDGSNIILWLNGGRTPTMQEVFMTSALSSRDDLYDFTIERTVNGVTRTGKADHVGVTFDGEKMLFGIGSQGASPVVAQSDDATDILPFQAGDRIVKVNDVPVAFGWDIDRAANTPNGEPLTVTVQRGQNTETLHVPANFRRADDYVFMPDGSSLHCRVVETNLKDKSITVKPDTGPERKLKEDQLDRSPENLVNFLGLAPRLKVTTVLQGSPADKQGLKTGDIIEAYGEKHNPTYKELMDVSKDKAEKKAPTEIEVLRGPEDHPETKTIPITPKMRNDNAVLGILVSGDWDHLVVAGPLADSLAAKAGIENGSTITQVNGQPVKTWIDLYKALRDGIGRELKITYVPLRGDAARAPKTVTVGAGSLTPAMFDPQAYRFCLPDLPFKPLMVLIKTKNPLEAIAQGGKQTVTWVLGTYVSIRSLAMGYASYKSAMGPVGLGAAAVKLAQEDFIRFVWFFAMISAAIAVFNFLPLPVMDGGYAVFLIVEKIRGKPLSVRVTNIIQMSGLVLLLGLFLFITYGDISKMIHGSWWF